MQIYEYVKVLPSVRPIGAVAGAVNGVAIDTEGYADAMAVVMVGATTGSPSSFTVDAKVQESANGTSGWTDISGAAITQVTAAAKTGEIAIPLRQRSAHLRYVRVVITPAFSGGSTPTVGISASVILANPEVVSGQLNSTTAD